MKEIKITGDAPIKSTHVQASGLFQKAIRANGTFLTITHQGIRITVTSRGSMLHYAVNIDL